MVADAAWLRDASPVYVTVEGAAVAGEMRQLANGKAAWLKRTTGAAAGDATVPYTLTGQVTVPKATGLVFLDGGNAYWDYSAQVITYKQVDDQDFLVGSFVGNAATGATTATVLMNEYAQYKVDIARDPFVTAIVGTQALGGLALNRRGGSHNIVISATNEAQKVDLLSQDGFSNSANGIVEMIFTVPSDGAGTVVDVSVGVANATHATDASAATRRLFIHLDANSVNISAESSDGTTTVAITDTTIDYTEGQTVATRKEVWFDMRTSGAVVIYVDGVRVLAATVFGLAAMAATWYLLCHIEKTASTDAYEFDLNALRVRTARQ